MAETSSIEWTDATWNPITGCSVLSPGCKHCYAMGLAGTRLRNHPSRVGLTIDTAVGPVWNGEVRLNEDWLEQPLQWRRPRRIFVCAHGDLFHESIPDEWIDRVFAVMALAPQHTFQVLTKRSARMRAYFAQDDGFGRWGFIEHRARQMADVPSSVTLASHGGSNLPNVWLGVSAEDQARADERIPDLLTTPAAVRFISLEPLLGPIDVRWALSPLRFEIATGLLLRRRSSPDAATLSPLDWVIVGGESGSGARPMHPAWARWIRNDCAAVGVPFFFKQWGEWTPGENVTRQKGFAEVAWHGDDRWTFGEENLASTDIHIDDEPDVYRVGKKAAGRRLDGLTHDAMPGPR